MSGLSFALNTAKVALAAQQYGLNVAGHNIANVNTDGFSRQRIPFSAKVPVPYGGVLLGNGVEVQQIERVSNAFIEERLVNLKSDLAAFDESSSYISILEGYFSEESETSISSLITRFWNSWHDVSNNPAGPSERVIVYETGSLLSERFESLHDEMSQMGESLGNEIAASLPIVNSLCEQIARLNYDIVSIEARQTANDQRDKRNTLLTELGQLIGVETYEQGNGALTVTTANGYVLVSDVDSYNLETGEGKILYRNSYGTQIDITENVEGGAIGGWLEMKEEVLPKYISDLDVLANEFIWTTNLAHSQGVGQEFFSEALTGTYAAHDSGLFSTLAYGDKIDYSGSFKMWVQDTSTTTPSFYPIEFSMGISDAAILNWTGINAAEDTATYTFTVTDSGSIDEDGNAALADGPGLGVVQTGADVSTALSSAVSAQTLTVFSTSGARTITVADAGGDAQRSAASIANALSAINGVTGHASRNSATIDIGNLFLPGSNAHENDLVTFNLVSAGSSELVSFEIGPSDATTRANFLDALNTAVSNINGSLSDLSVDSSQLAAQNIITIASEGGENIGIENFNVGDMSTVTMDNFANMSAFSAVDFDTSGFANFNVGDTLTMNVQGQTFNLTLIAGDTANAAALSAAFTREFNAAGNAAALAAANITVVDNAGSFSVTSSLETIPSITFSGGTGDTGNDATLAMLPGNIKTSQSSGGGAIPGSFEFTGTGTDYASFSISNQIGFDITSGADTETVTVDLTGVDTTDQSAVASAFYDAVTAGRRVNVTGFTRGVSTGLTLVQTTPEVDLTFDNTFGDLGNDASFDLIPATGTTNTVGNQTLSFAGGDTETFTALNNTDTILFDGATLTESGGAGDDSGVKAATLTINLDPGFSIQSDVAGAAGGIFNLAANTNADMGNTVMSIGGDGGFSGFDIGDRISFSIDGTSVIYIIGAGDDTDVEYATGIETALNSAGLNPLDYSIVRNGATVSILKRDGTPINLTNFTDDQGGGGGYANLTVAPGTMLDATHTSASSRVFGPNGVLSWEKYDEKGLLTGDSGRLEIDTAGTFLVDGTLAFDISPGNLVAGNTFSINTDTDGIPNPLSLTASRKANSILDTYRFTVDENAGGTIGADDVTIQWENSLTFGTFTLEGQDPPFTPVTAEADGMFLQFDGGTVFEGDTFVITTDESGNPATELPSDWHWTMESFADRFNSQARGIDAQITNDNKIQFEPDTSGYKIDNTRYSGSDGFCEANVSITVNNYEIMDNAWTDLRIARDDIAYQSSGGWRLEGVTNPGYDVTFTPFDGLDMDNGFYVNFDGRRAFSVEFNNPISDDGSITLDIAAADGEYSFAFSDDTTNDSGVAAALGVNTFFTGNDVTGMGLNSMVEESKYIAAATIDGNTGEFASGDNSNSIAIANLQFSIRSFAQWNFTKGEEASSQNLDSTLEEYFHVMIGSMGLTSQSITRSRDFTEAMTNQIGEQRDAISAVSLDEEMINMMKFQHAYTVAAKLLTVVDEMLASLIASK